MAVEMSELLRTHGIRPSAQRMAVAAYVLRTRDHPSADRVWERVRRAFPEISRATVYNTLNLFQSKGLVRALVLEEGRMVYDPKKERHHHFIDDRTGRIFDVPWEAVNVRRRRSIPGFTVTACEVVLRGRRRPR